MTYVGMYENTTKWIELGPWIQLRTLLPTADFVTNLFICTDRYIIY